MPGPMATALAALACPDPARKGELACLAQESWHPESDDVGACVGVPEAGRPCLPELVRPNQVPRRGLGTPQGRTALLHALAHIEFNAINLALDAACRFTSMPAEFRRDWLLVAAEEARHFRLLADCLAERDCRYGDLPAHAGLWDVARRTRDDVLARMALVPRVLEARGLDVTPGLRDRLAAVGDGRAAAILEVILADEVGHVAIGNHWYHRLCAERGLDPLSADADLAARYGASRTHPPFNVPARLAAGFTEAELSILSGTRS